MDVPYKIGKRTTDVMLEILNLNKKEVISIDSISNQEFSEVRLCAMLSPHAYPHVWVQPIYIETNISTFETK